MYVLYANDQASLSTCTDLFNIHFEPMLQQLELFTNAGNVPANIPEIPQYLQVCRWPFRKLEYSFVLDVLLQRLKPGDRYLDAGCGATPLSHIFAATGVQTDACDFDARLIEDLRALHTERIYGSQVAFSRQDLTSVSFTDSTFDAISCVSVLEHIPAPQDQKALREMLRILKPGGILVLTIDYTPPASGVRASRISHYIQRVADLVKSGNIAEIGRGIRRKAKAQQAVRVGSARLARSANQCFEIGHLEQDILPILQGEELPSRLPFPRDLRSMTPNHARDLWKIDGLYYSHSFRAVLPAAVIMQKPMIEVTVSA